MINLSSVNQNVTARPNILLIVTDATRASNLSCYGYHRPTTPKLERLVERGILYEKAFSAGCWSLPGHASIFTGLYPATHGANDQHQFLSPQHPTLAEVLGSCGYRTVAICHKRDVGPVTGLDRGFEWFNPITSSSYMQKAIRKINAGLAKSLGRRDKGARYTNHQLYSLLPKLHSENRPFFIFASYTEAHIPYRPPNKYNIYLPPGVSPRQAQQVNQDRWKYMTGHAPMSEQDFDILTALYDGAVAYTDARLAQLFDYLEQLELLDDMIIVIVGDHGENLGEHQLMGHGYCMYDTAVHVPLIIHYPKGTVAPGRVLYQVQTVDILPSILAVLGDTSSELYHSLQGHNLLSSDRHEFTIAEQSYPDMSTFDKRYPNADVSKYNRALKMIRTEQYKYVWASDDKHELYDLQADPDETHNIITEQPHVANDLARRLNEWRARFDRSI